MPRRALLILFLCGLAGPASALTDGEFGSTSHRKVIWSLYASAHNRGLYTGWTLGERFGAGFGLGWLISPELSHTVNKLAYFTVDNTFTDFFASRFVHSVTPGFLVRTWLPFVKFGYGAGVDFRSTWKQPTVWGVAASAQVEFHGFYLSSRFIFPVDGRPVENEIRCGFLFAGRYR